MDIVTYALLKKKIEESGNANVPLVDGQYDPQTGMPTISNPNPSAIYLVPDTEGIETNLFTEWIYANDNWEKFGSAAIDLDGCVRHKDVDDFSDIEYDNTPIYKNSEYEELDGKTVFDAINEAPKDVQINGTSVVQDGVAKINAATPNSYGVVKVSPSYGFNMTNGFIATDVMSKNKYDEYPYNIVVGKGTLENIKSDLTKRALTDESQPEWTDEEKASARARIGVSESGTVDEVAREEIAQNKAEIQQLNYSLDALWKLNEGQTYTISQKVESGTNIPPNGAKFERVVDIRGNSTQDGEPSPTNPVDIVSVEQINISVDGIVRTIIPPFPLNKIGDYFDKADIDDGVWVKNIVNEVIQCSRNNYATALGYRYLSATNSVLSNERLCLSTNHPYNPLCGMSGYSSPNLGIRINADTNQKRLILEVESTQSKVDVPLWYISSTPTEYPISSEDLDYLRGLELIDTDSVVIITDQDGNDISYLMEYIIKLNEVN